MHVQTDLLANSCSSCKLTVGLGQAKLKTDVGDFGEPDSEVAVEKLGCSGNLGTGSCSHSPAPPADANRHVLVLHIRASLSKAHLHLRTVPQKSTGHL